MPKPYPKEFRDDVVRVAQQRESGVTLKQVAKDPEWIAYLEKDGIDVVDHGRAEFNAQVQRDVENFEFYLKKFGLVK